MTDHGFDAVGCGLLLREGSTMAFERGETIAHGTGRRVRWHAHGGGTLVQTFTPHPFGMKLDVRILLEAPERVDQIVLAEFDVAAGGYSQRFANYRDIWLPTGQHDAAGAPLPDLHKAPFPAHVVLALHRPGGPCLLAGLLLPGRHGMEATWADGRLRIALRVESGVAADGVVLADSLLLRYDEAGLVSALEAYGEANRIGVRGEDQRDRHVVWNTWDWFGEEIDQAEVARMARVVAETPVFRDHVDVICLDDGWANYGDEHTPYEHFDDLAGMAAAIRAAGFIPGIWYAPFLVNLDSDWAKEHPETILWGEDRGFYAGLMPKDHNRQVLDPTHPLVLEKIRADLAGLRADGFRYYKTDFLQQVNSHFRRHAFHDKGLTPVAAVRRVMHLIRDAIGPDSFWLACGTEILPCAGLADAARVSDDIRPHVSTLTVAMRHCAAHFWANGRLWLNDPDFFICRCKELHKPEHPQLHRKEEIEKKPHFGDKPYERAVLGTGPVWTPAEARLWADFHIVHGGVISLGDHPEYLNQAGLELTATVLRWHGGGGRSVPLDLAERNVPRIWLRPHPGGWLLGLFNLEDTGAATISLTASDMRRIGAVSEAVDIHTGEAWPWPSTGEAFALELPARRSRVLHLR